MNQVLAIALLNSLESRFKGLLQNIAILPNTHHHAANYKTDDSFASNEPFGDSLYLIASARDPQFGLDWLDDSMKPVVEGMLIT